MATAESKKLKALKAAQRVRNFRQRLKEPGNEEKLAAYKERVKIYRRRYVAKQLLTNREAYRRMRSESNRKYRIKKAEKIAKWWEEEATIDQWVDRFMSSLPKNEAQATEIVQYLVDKYL